MPRILVDLYKIKTPHSGLGEYSLRYAEHLEKMAPADWELTYLIPPREEERFKEGRAKATVVNLQKRLLPALNRPFDIWHSLHQFPSHRPGGQSPWLMTVHDLNYLREKDAHKQKRYHRRLLRNLSGVKGLCSISHFTKAEVEQHTPYRVDEVIYNGIVMPDPNLAKAPQNVPRKPFFFSLGIFNPKKNFDLLLDVMLHLPNRILLLAGDCDTPYGERVADRIGELGLQERVWLLGKIPEEEKFWYYQQAEALLFPSTAEGFGMPPIEAMYFGSPVFLNPESALPEVGGDHAAYFESKNPVEIAAQIRTQLPQLQQPEAQLKRMQYARTFSWERTTEQYIEWYKRFL